MNLRQPLKNSHRKSHTTRIERKGLRAVERNRLTAW